MSVTQARSGAATMRFLPPYSPDFSTIEKAFSRLKAMLRKAGERTRQRLVGPDRQARRHLQDQRMRELLQVLRIRTGMNGNRSNN